MRRFLLPFIAFSVLAAGCGDDGGGSAAAWCDVAGDVDELADRVGGEQDADWTEFRDAVNDAKGSAPSEISDEVELLADWLDAVVDAIDDNDGNIVLALDDVTTNGDVDQDAIEAASDAVTAYNERECGIADDDADDGGADGDEPDFSDGLSAGLAEQLGISEEQARCLLENLDIGPEGEPDVSQIFDVLGVCDIDITDIDPG